MADDIKTETVTVEETAPEPEAKGTSREALVKEGATKDELARMEKRGMIAAEGEKKPEGAEEEEEKGDEGEGEEKPKAKTQHLPDVELSAEQEAVFLKTFPKGHPTRGLYFRMKAERKGRQAAERRAKDVETAKDQEIALLKARLGKGADEGEEGEEDLDAQPLTAGDLKKYEEEKAKAQREAQEKRAMRQVAVADAIVDQEAYAKEVFEDWEPTVKLAETVLEKESFAKMPKWKQNKAQALVAELQTAYQAADEVDYDGRSAAMIAYELGQLHESYGEKPKETVDSEDEGDSPQKKKTGALTPEQMKRIEENSKKRQSSASVTGSAGGKREVAVSEVTPQMFLRFTPAQRTAFRKEHPKRYRELVSI